MKSCTITRGRNCLDSAAVVLHHLTADRKPQTGAFVLLFAMQPVEQPKDFIGIFLRKADAIVPEDNL